MAVQTAGMAWQLHCCQGAFQDVRSLSGWTASCSSTWNSSSPSAAFVLRRCRQHKMSIKTEDHNKRYFLAEMPWQPMRQCDIAMCLRAWRQWAQIQIWVAMALDANGRYNECILLYKTLEAKHPAKNIRRQAMDLRFILEAPKLKISKDEMVSIPIIDADPNSSVAGKKSWTQTARERQSRARMMRAKIYDPLDDILNFKKPPTWQENPYVYVAFSVWSTLVIISLVFGNRH
ncbi:hypothetical protein CBR_g8379 [Chara braunii]|uniref:Uncharacterized protein n=1 Tax=Chara braunii TaxID=69332 RepID=A0A388KM01_CHABU|nr:hypothetical protein CBR_g8379 [Chara braunii]|eukprot:GBG71079.1 hypothetical protein CBR_g8379 [Chara braunii]